jgi:hypothetical protein
LNRSTPFAAHKGNLLYYDTSPAVGAGFREKFIDLSLFTIINGTTENIPNGESGGLEVSILMV